MKPAVFRTWLTARRKERSCRRTGAYGSKGSPPRARSSCAAERWSAKGDKPRTVFYGEAVVVRLRDYLRRRGTRASENLLFVNSLGEQLLRFAITARMRDYGEKAGITGKRVSPHTLRHTFAINWLMHGGDTLSLQRLLGHSTPAMTTRYVNFCTADLAELHRSVSPLDRLQAQNGAARTREIPAAGRKRLR